MIARVIRLQLHAVYIVAAVFVFLSTDCHHPTSPPPNKPDTTSQDFVISTWEYGDGYESAMACDVRVFDENNVWLAGLFPNAPSLMGWNIRRWNGSIWEAKGGLFNSSGIYGIWALDSSRIFLADGGVIVYRQGAFTFADLTGTAGRRGQSIQKIWASSETNVWGVGPFGTLVHYDGRTWTRLPFDTTYQFFGLTGSTTTGIAYATATNFQSSALLLELDHGAVEPLYQGGNRSDPQGMKGVTLVGSDKLWIAGATIRQFDLTTDSLTTLYRSPNGVYSQVIGYVAPNDIFFFGDGIRDHRAIHYNGIRFTEFVLPARSYINYLGTSGDGSQMILASDSDNKAYLIYLKRRSP